MSADSSRQVTVRSGEPTKMGGESSTSRPLVAGNFDVHLANQPTIGSLDMNVPRITTQPGSGRPHVARLPVVDKALYSIDDEVARGGIGRVLSARDARLDRRVAVKVLLEESGTYEDRFVREALVTARLQHPSIVPVYEAGRWPSGEPFYSMKLVSGKPLLEIIEQTKNLDERLPLLTRILAVADAMAYAHERRIIHRDLKPANILVGDHGETVLIDWGLAKDLNEANVPSAAELGANLDAPAPENNTLTMVGSVMGTPSYMPPEQAAGDFVDERADVYALGSILYHVLSGKQPYAGYNGMQTIMRVLEEPPQALEALQAGIPRDLLTIIEKAMHRDPAARYPTAKEFAEDLRRFLAGQLVGAHVYSSRERLLRFVQKHRTAFGVAAVAFVVMVVSGAVSVNRVVKERDRAEAERNRAEAAHKKSIAAEAGATVRADELTLVEARAAVERDPNIALAWLKALSPSFHKWNAARVIAADAWSRGTSTAFRHHRAYVNSLIFSPDETFFLTTSDDRTARVVDLKTGESRSLEGHTDEVWAASVSSDGKRVLTASKDRTIRLWDVASGKTLRVFEGHESGIVYSVFSRDEKSIFSQSDDSTLRVWDVETGKNRILVSGPEVAQKSVVAPDQQHFATAGYDGSIWYVGISDPTPKRINALQVNTTLAHVVGMYPFLFSPDGRRLLAGGVDGVVREWDLREEKARVWEGQTSPISRIAYSPDGHQIVAASIDGSIRMWDVMTGKSRVLPGQDANVSVLAFSSDGRKLVAAGYDKSARVIDLTTGRRRRFVGMHDFVTEARFTKDGNRLFVTSGDGTVRVFQLQEESGRLLGKHAGAASSVDVSNRGDLVVSGGQDGKVRLWPTNPKDRESMTLAGHEGNVLFVKFSPDGEFVLSSGFDGTVRLWDRAGHQIRGVYVPGLYTSKIAFSPQGHSVAIANSAGLVQLWDIETGVLRELGGHTHAVAHLSFSVDGKRLGTASVDRVAKVWDVESGASTELLGHDNTVNWIAFSPDGQTIGTGGWDHRLLFWDNGSSQPRAYDASGFVIGHLAFLPDGSTILGCNGGSNAQLWEVSTGKTLQTFRGHRGNITSLALAQDGSVFATSSDDHTVRFYDIETSESRVMGVHEGPVRAVGIDPRGQWAVSVSDDGTVRMWSDDLPREPDALRAWIEASVPDVINVDALGEGSVPLP
jgi:eukaryotic-like serine/threonine-protein kinase